MLSSKILLLYLSVLTFYVEVYTMIIFVCFFRILLYVTSAAAGYNMLQLCKHSFSACSTIRNFNDSYYMHMAWISFLLDQVN